MFNILSSILKNDSKKYLIKNKSILIRYFFIYIKMNRNENSIIYILYTNDNESEKIYKHFIKNNYDK